MKNLLCDGVVVGTYDESTKTIDSENAYLKEYAPLVYEVYEKDGDIVHVGIEADKSDGEYEEMLFEDLREMGIVIEEG